MRRAALFVAIFAVVLVCGSPMATGEKPPDPNKPTDHVGQPGGAPATSIAMPDLVVEKMEVTTQPSPGGGTTVMVSYTVRNNGPVATRLRPTAAGTKAWHDIPSAAMLFACWFDMRDYPNGSFGPLQAGTALELGPFQSMKISDGRVVPPGKRVEFRATADSMNWIAESNETNNRKTLIWPPLPVPRPRQK